MLVVFCYIVIDMDCCNWGLVWIVLFVNKYFMIVCGGEKVFFGNYEYFWVKYWSVGKGLVVSLCRCYCILMCVGKGGLL